MKMFGVWSLTWWPGAILFLTLGMIVAARWFRFGRQQRRRGVSTMSFSLVHRFFTAPPPEGGWSNPRWFVLMWLFGLTSMISVCIGDLQDNAPCIDACKADDWSNGRLRGDPHAAPGDGPFTYECWCYTGSEWSAAPIEPERLQP